MTSWTRRSVMAAMGALPLGAARAGTAATGSWPSEPIRIVVPFGPGGSTDAVARLAAPGLQQRLGVPIIIENRSGAAGSIGTDAAAKARPDLARRVKPPAVSPSVPERAPAFQV